MGFLVSHFQVDDCVVEVELGVVFSFVEDFGHPFEGRAVLDLKPLVTPQDGVFVSLGQRGASLHQPCPGI